MLPIPVIVGPTGSGKSRLALDWAARHRARLLSVDSRQFYRHLDIGTAKPAVEERARVPHEGLDLLDPHESWTAQEFAQFAWRTLEQAQIRGQRVILAGGSTLHLTATVHGLSPVPVVPAEVRAELQDRLDQEGLAPLVEELLRRDPASAALHDLSNPRRVLRALEVLRHTGRPIQSFYDARTAPPWPFSVLYLRPSRAWLYPRLDARVDEMIEAGLVAEVEAVIAAGVPPEAPGLNTIGYREVVAYLQGERPLADAITAIKRNTRRYAKRQLLYFDKYFPDAIVIDPARTLPDDAAIDRMIAHG